MLDIKFIRENKDLIELATKKKKLSFDVNELLSVDDERLTHLKNSEDLRAIQNKTSESISAISDSSEKSKVLEEMKAIKARLQESEGLLKTTMEKWQKLMLAVPNIPDVSVPDGDDDSGNLEVHIYGNKPAFNFSPKSHIEILEAQDMVDFERGSKVSGFRGYYLKGDMAMLEMAIWQYVMQRWQGIGYTPMLVPSLVKRQALFGSGYLPQGEADLYKDADDYLAGTGEVAMMYYFADEVIDVSNTHKYIAWSPCFRKEAGSHSKDVKGLIRVHEFYKCEQVVICEASHEKSVELHEEIRRNSESMLEELGVHYHTVVNCGGDLGLGQVKKYDIEGWLPSQNRFLETHSASYFHDFQTRRLGIKYKNSEGKLKFAHSLNNTAAATPRLLTIIVENYQNQDGTINVPEALVPFMGGKKIIGKPVW